MSRTETTRVGRIAEAYLLASIGAGAVVGVAFAPIWGPLALFALVVAIPAVLVLALVPSIVLIVWAERRGVRSRKIHVGAGAAMGVAIGGLVLLGPIGVRSPAAVLPLLGLALAGAFGGWIYHRVAGRNAGA